MFRTGWATTVCFTALALAPFGSSGEAAVTTGYTLNYEAALDPDTGNSAWENLTGVTGYNFALGSNVSYNASPTTATTIAASYTFPSFGTDNSTDKATIAGYEALSGNPTDASASFELWFKPSSLTGGDQVLWETGGATDGSSFTILGGSNVQFTVKDGNANFYVNTSLEGLENDFIQVVGTYEVGSPNTLKLYVNGTEVTGSPKTSGSVVDWAGSDVAGLAGRNNDVGGKGAGGVDNFGTFAGDVAIHRFYEFALTAAEVGDNFNALVGDDVYFLDTGDDTWETAANWSTGYQPAASQNTYLGGGLTAVVSQDGEAAGTLTVGSSTGTPGTGTLNITAGSLSVTGDLTIGDGHDGAVAVDGGVLNVGGNVVKGTSAASLTLNGTLGLGDGSTVDANLSLDVTGDSTFHVASGTATIYSDVNGSGTSLTKSGDGALILDGTLDYDNTTITGGVLQINDDLPDGTVEITSATLALNNGTGITHTGDVNFTTDGGVLHAVSGTNEIYGDASDNLDVRGDTTFTVDAGAVLNVNNNGGDDNIGFGNNPTLILDGEGEGTIYRDIARGDADGTIIKNGTGTWTLAGVLGFEEGWSTGGLIVNEGTLATGVANVVPYGSGKGNVTVNSPGVINLDNGGLNVNGLEGDGTIEITGSTDRTLTLGHGDTTATFAGTLQNTGSGVLNLTKTGTGTQALTGTNTYSGTTTLNDGVLQIGDGGTSGSIGTGSVIINAATLALNRSDGVTLSNTFDMRDGSKIEAMVGVNTISGTLNINNVSDMTATFQVDDGATLNVTSGNIGLKDTIIYLNADGDGVGTMGKSFANGNANATVYKTGTGTWILSNSANAWSTGGLIIEDGVLQLGANNVIPNGNTGAVKGNVVVNGPGILDLNGKNETVNGLEGDGTVDNTSATACTFQIGDVDVDSEFAGTIQNSGGAVTLTKIGAGTFTLSGTSTYTGLTNVNAGTLLVDGSIASQVAVNGGTLGGTGSIGGAVTVNSGSVAPGNSPGTLTLEDGLQFLGGAYEVEIDGVSAYDQLVVIGLVDLGDELADLTVTLGDLAVVNTSYTIIDNDGDDDVVGIFAGLDEGALVVASSAGVAGEFRITYFGGDGNDVVLTAVPEPSTLALLAGLAVTGLIGYLRRRRAA